ncbi:MAG TPA: hypothetical protein VFS93_04065 [Terrimesophilobacter sp.]|nr:hypothetical protein [Terrimesophilobacter sp.]
MKRKKPKPVQQFPVMDGGGPAPREEQIAGIDGSDGTDGPSCPAHALVECLYRDVEQLERASS